MTTPTANGADSGAGSGDALLGFPGRGTPDGLVYGPPSGEDGQ